MTMTHAFASLTQEHPRAAVLLLGCAFAFTFLSVVALVEVTLSVLGTKPGHWKVKWQQFRPWLTPRHARKQKFPNWKP